MKNPTFEDLGLIEPLLRALKKEGYEHPTPIQKGAIPELLEGRDLLGLAQTGTGKTAAFALPTLQYLSEAPQPLAKKPYCLVLTPTRELAIQVGRSFTTYGQYLDMKTTVIFGGVGQQPQANALAKGVDILVATPGRLLDLMGQKLVFLDEIEVFVLDEADRMLDMGFIHDVKKIVAALPEERQSLFFSATMPPAVEELANSLLTDPATVTVNPVSSTAERIEQSVCFVDKGDKELLLRDILNDQSIYRVLVFTRTKHRANRVADKLLKNRVEAAAIHGNKSQTARQKALDGFIKGTVRVLVATDIAARGIDVDGIDLVVNFELPNEPESYVHRIGRTARAGAEGKAVAFCEAEERPLLYQIEKTIKQQVPVVRDHGYHSDAAENASTRGSGPIRGGLGDRKPDHRDGRRGPRGGHGGIGPSSHNQRSNRNRGGAAQGSGHGNGGGARNRGRGGR